MQGSIPLALQGRGEQKGRTFPTGCGNTVTNVAIATAQSRHPSLRQTRRVTNGTKAQSAILRVEVRPPSL